MSKYYSPLDLTGNELRNVCLQALAANPSYKQSLLFFRTSDSMVVVGRGGAFEYLIPSGEKGAASGIPTLDSSSLVVQNPANAQLIAAVGKIPIAGASGKLDVSWLPLGSGNGIDADKLDNQDGTFYLSRTNHTGTQLASTISDFLNTVFTARLDQMAIPTAAINLNNQRLTNVPTTPGSSTDAVNAAYVDQKLQGLGQKHSVRCATTVNITLSGLQTIDGYTVVAGDLVLVMSQTTASQNGVYVASAGAWSRSGDADTWTKLISAYCFVEQGTLYHDCGFTCTVDQGGTIETTSVSWVQFSRAGVQTVSSVGLTGQSIFKQQNGTVFEFRSIAGASTKLVIALDAANNAVTADVVEANLTLNNIGGTLALNKGGTGGTTAAAARTNLGAVGKYTATIGDGSTATIVVTHNLGTQDIHVQVYETASPYNRIEVDTQATTVNTCTLLFGSAPTSGQFRVVVMG